MPVLSINPLQLLSCHIAATQYRKADIAFLAGNCLAFTSAITHRIQRNTPPFCGCMAKCQCRA